ncbi:MAG: D-ribose-binding periplasmic protein [Mycobacterium sp.]|nr:D-ribose-binding periplasmic protein [Mycobacterium sp.]
MKTICKVLPTLVCAATAITMSACSSSVNNNADTSAPSATNVQVDDGGCVKNHDQIAKAQQTLAGNLYGIAAQNSDKGTNTNPGSKGPNDPITITFSIEGLSHPFLVKQKQLAEDAAQRNGVKVNVVSANDDVNQQFNDIQTAIAQGTDALMMMPANTEGLGAVLSQAEAAKILTSSPRRACSASVPRRRCWPPTPPRARCSANGWSITTRGAPTSTSRSSPASPATRRATPG